ncbi:hypothetical protein [Pseudobacillus badius]|uniref:hypothetical protein n=1 Tax=Bacillus badius TaxID=1455 RepID=UPI0007B354C8|nr:hypothetical protein [Bacillus badius]KZR58984.1 hypothetical protein A3781_00300 [Bacillus badius]
MDIEYVLNSHGIGSFGLVSNDVIPPPAVDLFNAVTSGGSIILSWINPDDTDFAGIRIQRKIGSFPVDYGDGVTVYKGKNSLYVDDKIEVSARYYYRAFTYDYEGNYNKSETMRSVATVENLTKVYGVDIDQTNPDPYTAVTYVGEAVGLTPGSAIIDAIYPFNRIRPVLLNEKGEAVAELNKNDFSKTAQGGTAILNSKYNVMIEFPKLWIKIETAGDVIQIRFASSQIDKTYKCLAHKKGNKEKDVFYLGAYLSSINSGILRSWSGFRPATAFSIAENRQLSALNGEGYGLMNFYQMLYLQVLFIFKYKCVNSQVALGLGYTDTSVRNATTTGATDKKGMYYGSKTDNKERVKFLGLEDIYGNYASFLDGALLSQTYNLLTATDNYNDEGNGYQSNLTEISTSMNGFISKTHGTTELGFFPKEAKGASAACYGDRAMLFSGNPFTCGGSFTESLSVGMFYLNSLYGSSAKNIYVGSRLAYI